MLKVQQAQLVELTILIFPSKIKLMSHHLLLLVIMVLVGLLVSANIPILRVHLDSNSNILGVHISQDKPRIATDGGKQGFISNNDGAISALPLRIDPATGSLSVTTPKGEKVVTVLPDAAIKNMLASKVMSYVTSVPAQGDLASTNKLVTLTEQDDVLVYEIDGVREHKLLGLIPLKSQVKTVVSAENGQVLTTKQSLLGRILNRISP